MKVYLPDPALREALASLAIDGNRVAITALETVRRIEAGEPVGKRYADALNALVIGCAEEFRETLSRELYRGGAA